MLNINYATNDDDALILINDVMHDEWWWSILINYATDDDNVSITQPGQDKENKGQRHKHLVKEMALESTMLKWKKRMSKCKEKEWAQLQLLRTTVSGITTNITLRQGFEYM